MAFKVVSGIIESASAPGTGNVSLGSPTAPFEAFGDQYANNDQMFYAIKDATDFEEGVGTYLTTGDQLQRDSVIRSTNGGLKVNFGGVVDVYPTFPGSKVLVKNDSDEVDGPVHFTTSDVSGGSAASSADDLVMEVNADGGLTIITGGADTGAINFAAPGNTAAGGLAYDHSTDTATVTVNGSPAIVIVSTLAAFINDSANSEQTGPGLTINQGASTQGEIVSLKSDYTHGLTGISETDTFASLGQSFASGGGLRVLSISGDQAALSPIGYALDSSIDTTTAINSNGVVDFFAGAHDGLGAVVNLPTNGNAYVFRGRVGAANRALAIIDAEGDLHLDATSNVSAFDDHDDAALLSGLRGTMMPPGMAAKYGLQQHVESSRAVLAERGVVTYNDDGSHFISTKGAWCLQMDTTRQIAGLLSDACKRIDQLVERIDRMEEKQCSKTV